MDIILLGYLILNVTALAAFGLDKGRAVARRRRLAERTLLLVALFGPLGAYSGMKLFRHKTKRLKFKLVPIFLLLHAGLVAYLLVFGMRLP